MASHNLLKIASLKKLWRGRFWWLATIFVAGSTAPAQQTFDVVVYGGTAAGVMAAVSAAREGMNVALLEPGHHLGGMASGGLSATDFGNKKVIGGNALEFYKRVGAFYQVGRYGDDVAWYYEPRVGEQIFAKMANEAGVKVFFGDRLREKGGVDKDRARITGIRTEDGTWFRAHVYIDCSYEGDLMARAGVSYTWGRESSAKYGESLAGVGAELPGHEWPVRIPAYDEAGMLFPGVWSSPPAILGSGDKKVEAYNFRLCVTEDPANRIPFPKPEHYDPLKYELLARSLEALGRKYGHSPGLADVTLLVKLPNGKADANNSGVFSTDFVGGSWDYPEAGYERRKAIWNDHIDYVEGYFYFLTHDPRVPSELQREVNKWGLAKDEFVDTENWPHQLYVREARRMIGEYVMTQRDLQDNREKTDTIGMGSYGIDSHSAYRFPKTDGTVANEGDLQQAVLPYQIPYRILVPKRQEVVNLIVPVCVSASHVAYSSLRMEPQYMIMGQAAGIAASMAVKKDLGVQEIDVSALLANLRQHGAVLEYKRQVSPE